MANPPYVVSGNTAESSWANQVAESIVNPYPSTGARSSAVVSPTVGMTSYLSTNTSTEGLEAYNSAGQWRKPWNLPWGCILNKAKSSTQNISTSGSVISTLTQSTSLVDNRLLRATLTVMYGNTTAGAVNTFQVRAGGTAFQTQNHICANTVNAFGITLVGWYETTSTGSVTLDAYAVPSSGTLAIVDDPAYHAQLIVEDMGPAGAPA